MKILITGSNGFVGSYLVKQCLQMGCEVFATSKGDDLSSFSSYKNYHFHRMDFTDPFQVHDVFEAVKPNVVVHSGAMSKPDECELNQSLAYAVNVEATVQLLLNAATYKSNFIFLSTDFIFNGEKGMHDEDDLPDPISYYGQTKMQAEEAVKEYEHPWSIVRTVFVYGKPLHGRDSFVNMIAKKLKNNEPYKIVDDQLRTPTYAEDLAKGIGSVIQLKAEGIYHLCGEDYLTPYTMSMKIAEALNISNHQLQPVSSKDLNEIAKRPLNSGLCIEKAKRELSYCPSGFGEALLKTLF